MTDNDDRKKAAIQAMTLRPVGEVHTPTDVVYKVEPHMDPRNILATTYQMRNPYAQLGDGFFQGIDLMNYLKHYSCVMMMKKRWNVLDVCCGRCDQLPMIRWYKRDIRSYTGVDISRSNFMAATKTSARKKLAGLRFAPNWGSEEDGDPYYPFDIHLVESNVDSMAHPVTEQTGISQFDFAKFTGIEHMPKESGIKALHQLRVILKSDACVVLTSPITEDKVDDYQTQYAAHLYEWGARELDDAVTKAGFVTESAHGIWAKFKGYREKLVEHYPNMVDDYDYMLKYFPKTIVHATFVVGTPMIADEVALILTAS